MTVKQLKLIKQHKHTKKPIKTIQKDESEESE